MICSMAQYIFTYQMEGKLDVKEGSLAIQELTSFDSIHRRKIILVLTLYHAYDCVCVCIVKD